MCVVCVCVCVWAGCVCGMWGCVHVGCVCVCGDHIIHIIPLPYISIQLNDL